MMKTTLQLLFLILVLSACGTTEQNGYAHLVKVKKPKSRLVHDLPVKATFYRPATTELQVSVKLPNRYLLRRMDLDGQLTTQCEIKVETFANQFSKQELAVEVKRSTLTDSSNVSETLVISMPDNKDVYCKITVTDLNKHVYQEFGRFVLNGEFWLPIDVYHSTTNEASFLESNLHETDSFTVKSYLGLNVIGPPPYDEFAISKTIQPDSTFVVGIDDLNKQLNRLSPAFLNILPAGIEKGAPFGLRTSTEKNEMESIVYLSGFEAETDEMIKPWGAFWKEIGQNDPMKIDRLQNLYLQRVQYANASFASYKNGWMTDRGMVYIVMGPPDRIIDEMGRQTWSYGFFGESDGSFTFVRDPNNLHPQDYVLDRDESYFSIWQSAKAAWLNGEISALK